ncbi:MAG: aromatic ring-hydroxylating dioxygenase subunit alpha [Paracoccaceae bacterium]
MQNSDLSHVLKPIASANGLPNEHYVNEDMFQIEKQKLLFENWSGIGFAKDVPDTGDVMPVDFMGMPLLVVHAKDGVVRVFQNTCRHRGMTLVQEKKNIGTGAIRCAYHSWCYGQTGKLVTTPHVGGPGQNTHAEIKRDELGLIEIRSYIWRDVIFVNISGSAPEFTDYAANLITRWGEFDGQTLHHGGADSSFDFEVKCNWKLPVENYCESYHLPWIHPGLNSYSKLEDHYHIENSGKFSGQGTNVYRPTISDTGQKFPDFMGLSGKWDAGAEYVALYPNVLFAAHRDHAFALILEPLAKGHTVEHVEIYYASEQAAGPEFAELRKANAALWHGVLKEDIFVVEGMQKGRLGVHFDGGKFSPVMDSPTHCFHQWVALQLGGHPHGAL